MRIQIVSGDDHESNNLTDKTLLALEKEFKKDGSVTLTAENPDVIHIVGAWNKHAVRIAKQAKTRHIAIVHSPLGSLSPWMQPSSKSTRLSAGMTTVVASGEMEKELLNETLHTTTKIILNCVVTQKSSAALMTSLYKASYNEAINANDEAMWDDIERQVQKLQPTAEVIGSVIKNILYAHKLYERRNIPQVFLNQMAHLLENSDFDEQLLGDILKTLRLLTFTGRLEYIMSETAGLGEGYMPVPHINDKLAEEMLALVTNYI